MTKPYIEKSYIKYDNLDILYVPRVTDIPYNYYGVMSISCMAFKAYGLEQFDVLGLCSQQSINGKKVFTRVLIKRKK